jgi:phosphatidylserine decarboxylase
MTLRQHQYIERDTGRVCTERPFGDWIVNYLYSKKRERAPLVYELLGSQWFSGLLGWVNYDFPLGSDLSGIRRFLNSCAVNLDECLQTPQQLNSARKVFERQIRYWQCRPMTEDATAVVCPADSRVLLGSLKDTSTLFLKGKFFEYEELLGPAKNQWLDAFRGADFVVCRLSPDKYHYNHTPVAGVVADLYENDGRYHSCNPGPVVTLATPYSKNKRVVTVIDTDVFGGTGVGLVAMLEIVALMVGDIVQCYSQTKYQTPRPVQSGMFLDRGCPKSLFRPGSSTTVLLFQEDRIEFAPDLIRNMHRTEINSRYSEGLGRALIETDIKVRSAIGRRRMNPEEEIFDDI